MSDFPVEYVVQVSSLMQHIYDLRATIDMQHHTINILTEDLRNARTEMSTLYEKLLHPLVTVPPTDLVQPRTIVQPRRKK